MRTQMQKKYVAHATHLRHRISRSEILIYMEVSIYGNITNAEFEKSIWNVTIHSRFADTINRAEL